MKKKLEQAYFFSIIILTKLLQKRFPKLAARVFGLIWFRVQKIKPRPGREKWISECQVFELEHRFKTYRVYSRINWKASGQIVFVHGWSGRWDQFLELAAELYGSGFSIVSFDLPSHGENRGDSTDISELAEFIENVNRKLDLRDSVVICHSAGFLAWSLFSKLNSQMAIKLILIGSPGSFDFLIEAFRKVLKFNDEFVAELWEIVGRRIGSKHPKKLLDVSHMQKFPEKDVFIIHDKNDRDVDFAETEKLLQIWPNSNFLVTEKLGHNKPLKSEFVISEVVEFVKGK